MNLTHFANTKMQDFGVKNIALILGIAAVLGLLAWEQKPMHLAAIQQQQSKIADSARVLGANTVDPKILEQFQAVPVTTIQDNSKQAFVNYGTQLSIVYANDLLPDLVFSSEQGTQADTETAARENKLLADMQKIAVPSELADYHRLSLAYYSLIFLNHQGQAAPDMAAAIPLIAEQIDKLRTGYAVSAGVTLP